MIYTILYREKMAQKNRLLNIITIILKDSLIFFFAFKKILYKQ